MSWTDELVTASFRGIEFEISQTQDAIERRVVEHEYLYRDGADLDDTGRKARPTRLTAVFVGDDVRERVIALLRVCDEGATGPLRHPLFGVWQAKVTSCQVQHEHSRRDYAQVEIEFKEDGTNTKLELQSVGAAQETMTTAIADLQTAYDDLGTSVPAVQTAIDDATEYVTDVEDTEDDLTARYEQLEAVTADAVLDLQTLDPVDAWPVRQGLCDVLHDAKQLRERIERLRPSVIDHELTVDTPLVTLAIRLYGDPDRAEDLLRLNRVRNPALVPAGTVLRVHSA